MLHMIIKKVLLSLYVNRIAGIEKKSQQLGVKQDLNLCYYDNKRNNKMVFNSSRIGSTYKIKNVLKDLNKSGIINDVGRSRVILEFAKDINLESVFYNLRSVDFDKVGWLWDYYKEENRIIACDDCGILVKRKPRSQTKYCTFCAKKKQLEHNKAYKIKIKNQIG